MIQFKLFITVFLVSFLMACSTNPVHIEQADLRARSTHDTVSASCDYSLDSIADKRSNSRRLSPAHEGRELFSADLIEHIVSTLHESGFFGQVKADVTSVDINLVKAYMQHKLSNIVAQVVFLIQIENEKDIVVRGLNVSANWIGAQSEYVDVLSKAVDQAVEKMFIALNERCGSI